MLSPSIRFEESVCPVNFCAHGNPGAHDNTGACVVTLVPIVTLVLVVTLVPVVTLGTRGAHGMVVLFLGDCCLIYG